MTKGVAGTVFALGPRDFFDLDAATRTVHPAHGVEKDDRDVPEWDEVKAPLGGHLIIARASLVAATTTWLAVGAGTDEGFDPRLIRVLDEFYRLVNETLERMNKVE